MDESYKASSLLFLRELFCGELFTFSSQLSCFSSRRSVTQGYPGRTVIRCRLEAGREFPRVLQCVWVCESDAVCMLL